MLETQNPEIRVDEIMQRIQEKVRLRREAAPAQSAPPPQPPQSVVLNEWINKARDLGQIGVNVPPMFRTRGLKRMIAEPMAKVFLRLAQLFTRDQRGFNEAVVAALTEMVNAQATALDRAQREAATTRAELAAKVATVSRDASSGIATVSRDASNGVASVARDAGRLAHDLNLLTERVTRLVEQSATAGREQSHLRTSLSLQERRLGLLLEEARRRLPQPLDSAQLETFAGEQQHVDDAHYLGFEDAFRGTRDEIKERLSIYLPHLRVAGAPILDLGCGRGELIELLRNAGLKASGVDGNGGAVAQCRALGLDVAQKDLFETLHKTPDGSLGAVVSLHVVEHLPFNLVIKLVDEALRVLRSGGLLILETPNPQNVLVGSSNFYLDPTHRNPVHPQTLRYLVEARGFVQVDALMLHPFPEAMRLPEDSAVARFINEHFFGAQDYAVLGRRA